MQTESNSFQGTFNFFLILLKNELQRHMSILNEEQPKYSNKADTVFEALNLWPLG